MYFSSLLNLNQHPIKCQDSARPGRSTPWYRRPRPPSTWRKSPANITQGARFRGARRNGEPAVQPRCASGATRTRMFSVPARALAHAPPPLAGSWLAPGSRPPAPLAATDERAKNGPRQPAGRMKLQLLAGELIHPRRQWRRHMLCPKRFLPALGEPLLCSGRGRPAVACERRACVP